MSLAPNQHLCTCDQRQHACSPPCRVHPERGGGLGNPGVPLGWKPPLAVSDAPVRTEADIRDAIERIRGQE